MPRKTQSQGFAHVGIIIAIVLVVTAIAFGGWYVWQKNKGDSKQADNTAQADNTQQTEDKASTTKELNYLSLASGGVRLTLPEDWPYIKGSSDYCYLSVTSNITCEEGAIITPGAKVASQSGGPDYFGISVGVYDNPQQSSAEIWLEQDMDEGLADSNDTVSRTAINGYDTYYWKKIYSSGSTNTEDVFYAFTKGEKAVLIQARTYSPRTLDDGTQVGDFRKFESAIAEMANSIEIN